MGVNGIYGLSGSGLDIESMVKVGMMGKQNEYDRMYKKQTRAEWQKEAYADVYKNINDFNTSKLTDYKLQSKMSAMTASTNNSTAFSVSANGAAVAMSHKVEVKSLSSNAYLMSASAISRASSAKSDSINLKDSMFQSIKDNGDETYTVTDWNGNSKTVNAADTALSVTMNDGKSKSEDSARTVTMTYADLAGNKSFNDLASSINKLGLNITASYDSVNDTFSFYNKSGGADNNISITTNNDDTANLFNNLHLTQSKNGELVSFDPMAPESITGTATSYSGSTKVADLLGLTISDTHNETTKIGSDFVTLSGDQSGLENGVTRYTKNDASGSILVRESEDASGNKVYKTAEEPTGGSTVDWEAITGTTTNPVVTSADRNVETRIDRYETKIGNYVVKEVDSSGLDVGVKRYNKVGGSDNILVKESIDDEGNKVYKTAEEPTDGSTVNWDAITETTATNPAVETRSGYDVVTEAADQTGLAPGVTRYTKADDSGNILVQKSDDGNGNITYKVAEEPTDGSTVDWGAITKTTTENPAVESTYYNVKDNATGVTTRKEELAQALAFSFNDGNSGKSVVVGYGELMNMTIDDVVSKINNAGLNMQASFTNGVFSISNSETGQSNKNAIVFSNDNTAKFFQKLGIGDGTSGQVIEKKGTGTQFSAGNGIKISGTNGEIVVDGRSYTNITDNRATIGGVTYTLFDTTETAATVTVSQDTDAIVDRVKQFVEDYNTMLKGLQDKYYETKYSDYDVLTKTQEDAMTKEQVEKWNEKAKSGLLARDSYIGNIISKMREALSTPVEGVSGKYNSAFNIGITTITDQGKIQLDEDKLKKVLAEEPNSVYEIFGKMGDYNSTTKTSDFATSGVAQRLGDVFNTGLKSIKTHAGDSTEVDDNSELGNRIKEWQNKMSDFKTKMKTFEDLLYKKYDAMEQALQKLAMTMNYVSFNQQ